jgi:hypothetical protein
MHSNSLKPKKTARSSLDALSACYNESCVRVSKLAAAGLEGVLNVTMASPSKRRSPGDCGLPLSRQCSRSTNKIRTIAATGSTARDPKGGTTRARQRRLRYVRLRLSCPQRRPARRVGRSSEESPCRCGGAGLAAFCLARRTAWPDAESAASRERSASCL